MRVLGAVEIESKRFVFLRIDYGNSIYASKSMVEAWQSKFTEKLTGFNAFWYSHHLFVIVYALLIVHRIKLYLTHEWYNKTDDEYLASLQADREKELKAREEAEPSCSLTAGNIVEALKVSFICNKLVKET
ncbi:hypothetical protein DCAR_0622727 [Daucus carota subsp. sativus]|uniref:Uncharacterized protein n=1 Tax=Daucus carota subsp. sativus TaxID=79200 RepID=A0A175YC96_DAUCS|nr:hypothetical protein DCAR_0622727 [Daucus carota subsp. sativus]